MKRFFLITISLLVFGVVSAQQTADLGIWGGIGSYTGDMTQVDYQSSLAPAFGVFLRYNFNSRLSARATVMAGTTKATGEFETHPWEFSKSVTDLSAMAEFNFFRYIIGSKRYAITTYLLGGLGVSMYPYEFDQARLTGVVAYMNTPGLGNIPDNYKENVFAPNVPLGFGFKFNIAERWGLGMEAQLRKYFDDRLDDLDDPRKFYTLNETGTEGYWTEYTTPVHNNDWTFHLGIHVTYRFYRGKNECPVYENIN